MTSGFVDGITPTQRRVTDRDSMSGITSNKPGIYSITNTANGKVYVGCAISICRRIASHRSALRSNKHRNPLLQASWNEHGRAAFQFAVLEFCSVQDLGTREHFWINIFGSDKASKGFNIANRSRYARYLCLFFLLEKSMKSKGLNLEELMRSKDQNRLDVLTRLEMEKELVAWYFFGPKARSKAAAARQHAARLKAASKILDELMSLNMDSLMDLNAFGMMANHWRSQIKTDLKRIHPA